HADGHRPHGGLVHLGNRHLGATGTSISVRSCTQAAILKRDVTPRFWRMFSTCLAAVAGLTTSFAAICRFAIPLATNRAPSRSRTVSGAHGSGSTSAVAARGAADAVVRSA